MAQVQRVFRFIHWPAVLVLAWAVAGGQGCGTHKGVSQAIVTVEVSAEGAPQGDGLFLTGNNELLGSWNGAGLPMERTDAGWACRIAVEHSSRVEFKITRGSWRTEAVGADGEEMPNFSIQAARDTTIRIAVRQWRDLSDALPVLSTKRMESKGGRIELTGWRFSPDPASDAAGTNIDDADWERVEPELSAAVRLPQGWTGGGWFRLKVRVDSSLFGRPIALSFRQAGASRFYLNGKLLFADGTLPDSGRTEIDRELRLPHVVAFESRDTQTIAVHYACRYAALFHRLGYEAGFTAVLVPANPAMQTLPAYQRADASFQLAFTTVAAGLALLFLFLYLFDRTQRAAVSMSLLVWGVAFIAMTNYATLYIAEDRLEMLFYQALGGLFVPFMGITGLITGVRITGTRFPLRGYLYVVAAAVITVCAIVYHTELISWSIFAVIVLPSLEWIWLIRRAVVLGQKEGTVWRKPVIIGAGATAFVAGVMVQLLMNTGVVRLAWPVPPYYLGFLGFALALLAQLAYGSAHNARVLEEKLNQVAELSRKTLEQERLAHQEELRRKEIESDNLRKTKELDEARALQLSMLPREVPSPAFADIAVNMSAATEVGGDYYDFQEAPDGTLFVAVGDATGHGTRAGIMVATMKGLFTAEHELDNAPEFFERSTKVFRKMRLGNLFMSLAVVKVTGDSAVVTSAGMPPVLILRAASGAVEQIITRSMPLGAHEGFPYVPKPVPLAPGDAIVCLSDGFTELFNPAGEQLETGRIIRYLGECSRLTADGIIDFLLARCREWSGGIVPVDDMTVVVVKMKETGTS